MILSSTELGAGGVTSFCTVSMLMVTVLVVFLVSVLVTVAAKEGSLSIKKMQVIREKKTM